MKRSILLTLVCLAILGLAQTTPSATENVAAVVNGYVITKDFLDTMADLKRILIGIRDLDEKFFNVLTGTDEGLLLLLRYKLEVLNDLIDQLLIQQLAEREGVLPSDEEVKKYVESEISDMLEKMKISERDFDEFLKQTGTSLEAMKTKLMWIYKTKRALDGLMDKVTKDVRVSEEEIESYYELHKDEFKLPPSVRLRVIVLNTKEDAQRALERLMNGEDFSKVASDMSVDEDTRSKGGDVGWVVEGSEKAKRLMGSYQSKVFLAPKLAILGPYNVSGKWVIFRIIDKKESSYLDLEKVRKDIEEKLLQEKKDKIWREWYRSNMEEFRKKSDIEIYMGKK